MSMGVFMPMFFCIGHHTRRGFLYAYSILRVFSGPQNTDKQDRNPRFLFLCI